MQDLFNFLEIASEQTATRGSHCSEVTGVSPVGGQVVACPRIACVVLRGALFLLCS
jgi:hypothetical protein